MEICITRYYNCVINNTFEKGRNSNGFTVKDPFSLASSNPSITNVPIKKTQPGTTHVSSPGEKHFWKLG